jgi:hypothetical protein
VPDPVTAPTPDDLARGWVEKNLPALRPTDGSYRQPVALCMQDAFRAGFATAVGRAVDVAKSEGKAMGYSEADGAELDAEFVANCIADAIRKLAG